MPSVLPVVWIMMWSEVTRPGNMLAQTLTALTILLPILEVSEIKTVQKLSSSPSFRGYGSCAKYNLIYIDIVSKRP